MFSEGVEWQVDVHGPKNGPVPGRPVNGYRNPAYFLRVYSMVIIRLSLPSAPATNI